MAKQIKVVHDVHIAWCRYASTSIIEPKPSQGTQINYKKKLKMLVIHLQPFINIEMVNVT